MFRSLRVQQTIYVLLISLIPLFIVSGVIAQSSFSSLEAEAIEAQEQEAIIAAKDIAAFIQERENQLQLIAEVRSIGTLTADEQEALLNALLRYDSAFQELALLDANGQELVRVARNRAFIDDELGERSTDEAFTFPKETGSTYYSEVRFDEVIREPLLTMAVPVIDLLSGETEFVLVTEFRFRPIWDLIAQVQGRQPDSDIYVTDIDGRLVAHANPSLVLRETLVQLPDNDGRTAGLSADDVILSREAIQNGNQTLVVVAEQNYNTATRLASDNLRTSIIILVISAIAALILVSLALSQALRPLSRLTRTANEISQGNFAAAADESGPTEIQTLAKAFNSMTGQLREFINTLEARVGARTHDLQIAATVSSQITTILDTSELLAEVTKQLQEGFDFYNAAVFLFSVDTQSLPMSANTGRNGAIRLENIAPGLDAKGLIPKAARHREPIVVNNVFVDQDFVADPQLPDTQSELAIPIVVGGKLVGVLDLQSDEADRFGSDELQVLPTLAQQIGIAIENARLFTEAEVARQTAEESNQIKSQFLANMSHELRTPLNAILNFTGFVAKGVMGPVNERQQETLQDAIDSGKHLLSLINDILDITKIEAGLMDLFIQEVDINEIMSATEGIAKGLVKDLPITLDSEIDSDLPKTFGDKRRLRQVMLNLISNAVKFTPEGKVTIRATCQDALLRIVVTDTGIGIAPEDQSLVFDSFKQAKHDIQDAIGTGLGMPISKYFVEIHGGRIWLESEAEVGTTFFVELPIMTQEEVQAINERIAEKQGS